MKLRVLLLPLLLLFSCLANAGADQTAAAIVQWRQAHEQQIVDGFAELLAIPNVASDRANIRRNADYIAAMFRDVGMQTELLQVEGGNPVVYAERNAPAASRTVMIYVHYDGQPVNPDNWASDPWHAVLRTDLVENGGEEVPMQAPFDPEWRIFGRSAGDDKAPLVALHSALGAMQATGIDPTVNLKLFIEGEEEAGSPSLSRVLEAYRDKLAADLWLFCDGPAHQSRRWQLVYGVRGADGFDLTVYGPNRPLHSGHYGNWAPNPIMLLTELITSMRAPSGDILVDGFSDQVRPLTAAEEAAIAASPPMDAYLTNEFGIGAPETSDRVERAITRPAINLRGISGGDVGAMTHNVISPSATASIGLRLVPDQTPAHLHTAIERHIETQGFHVIHAEPTAEERRQYARLARVDWSEAGYPAYRAPMDNPLARKISAILNTLSDDTLIQTPTMGGSLPLYIVHGITHSPILILPVANHDDNQHGANENLRLKNLWDAIDIYAAVLSGL